MRIKDTVPIVYNGGAYGTYLEWVLVTLTTDCAIIPPFTQVGNSHRYTGKLFLNINQWNTYANSTNEFQFVRIHPKESIEDSISTNLEIILSTVNKMIYIYPDRDSVLLNINNSYSKVWDDWWAVRLTDPIFAHNLYSSWSVNVATPVDQIPLWILREILSFNFMPSWYDEVEWYHPDHWQHPKCSIITISELLYNFEESLDKIQKFCNLRFTKNINQMIPYHKQMLQLQSNLDQDSVCRQIIQAVITDQYYKWKELPLLSQSWVQWELRNNGIEIKCNGLDNFPTDSVQLKKLLYNL